MNDVLFCKSMFIKLLLLGAVFYVIAACSTEYIYVDHTELHSSSIQAVLRDCTESPVGYVGSTNLSLAKAYITTLESLNTCKGISTELIEYLKE